MRKKYYILFVSVICLTLVSNIFGQDPNFIVTAVCPQADAGRITPGVPFYIDIYIDNQLDPAEDWCGGSFSYFFYSPDASITAIPHDSVLGGLGSSHSIEYQNGFGTMFDIKKDIVEFSWNDGTLPDSVNFQLAGLNCLPVALPSQAYIRFYMEFDYFEEGQFCIDSLDYPAGLDDTWDWKFWEYYIVEFNGPYCFTVEHICVDTDGDMYGNPGNPTNTCLDDNCPDDYNPGQEDIDGDGIGDICDGCPYDATNDADGDGICGIRVMNLDDSGTGSLRWAFDIANSNPVADTITFNVSGTIALTEALPVLINDETRIYGSNSPGGAYSVILDGSAVGTENGIEIADASGNYIEGLTITGFPENGIAVTGLSSLYNTFTHNQIYDNGGLALDLNDDSVTENDAGDTDNGPNDLVNYPILDSVYMNPDNSFTVYGTAVTSGSVEIYLSHPSMGRNNFPADPLGHGEAFEFVDAVTTELDNTFIFDIDPSFGHFAGITTLFIDDLGNTSEFSNNAFLVPAPLIIVCYSPVNIKVTDPNGDYIGRDADGVLTFSEGLKSPDRATYIDGEFINDSVTISHPIPGDYQIEVIAEKGTAEGETYSVGIRINGTAEAIMVANAVVPAEDDPPDIVIYETTEDFHFVNGDADGNDLINILDIIYLINYKYKSGPAPYPEMAGEINCIAPINILDIIYLINYKYKNGPEPCLILEN